MDSVIENQELTMAVLNGLLANYETLTFGLHALGLHESTLSDGSQKSRLIQKRKRAEISEKSSALSVFQAGAGGWPENGGKRLHKKPYRGLSCGHNGHSTDLFWREGVNERFSSRPERSSPKYGKKISSANMIEEETC